MSVLFHCSGDTDDRIFTALKAKLPAHPIAKWPNCEDKTNIKTAVVWQPPPDFFDELDNLEHILSVSAGVDHLLNHPGLPADVDIVRLTDAGMAEPMAQFVLYGALHAQRQMSALAQAQRNKQWRHDLGPLPIAQFHVGILGAGELSVVAANRLLVNGFKVSCWSRSTKQLNNIPHFAGRQALDELLPDINALVCLLPLTDETRGILDASLLSKLPDNAFLINPGRGDHLDEQALLNELNSGRLSGALLDVFSTEPLPESHPFWTQPDIIITPHVAAPTDVSGAIEQIAESLKMLEVGEKPRGLVDRNLGY